MRTALINALFARAQQDSNIMLIAGDLGYGVLDTFAQNLPKQYLNAGVAEQNMTGVATGLAMTGKAVFTYSIANFPTLRCFEQIRNDVCYHQANVNVISVGAGYAYGSHGYTHQGIEDISVMRALPNIQIYCPADPVEAEAVLEAALAYDGPCYIRLGKAGEAQIHQSPVSLLKQGIIPVHQPEGAQVCILSTGSITFDALTMAQQHGWAADVYSVAKIKPFDSHTLMTLMQRYQRFIVLEEHVPDGGLGSAVLEAMHDIQVQQGLSNLPLVHRIAIRDIAKIDPGSQKYMRQQLLDQFETVALSVLT